MCARVSVDVGNCLPIDLSCSFRTADAVFLILYKELYYRHIYAKVSVSSCLV